MSDKISQLGAADKVEKAIEELISQVYGSIEKSLKDASETAKTSSSAPTAFISYSHSDIEIADKLKQALEKKGIVVRIDHAGLEAGANT